MSYCDAPVTLCLSLVLKKEMLAGFGLRHSLCDTHETARGHTVCPSATTVERGPTCTARLGTPCSWPAALAETCGYFKGRYTVTRGPHKRARGTFHSSERLRTVNHTTRPIISAGGWAGRQSLRKENLGRGLPPPQVGEARPSARKVSVSGWQV